MENKPIQKIKSYDPNKLENFLNKVVNKLEDGTENVGKDNENIITNWLNEFKQINMSNQKLTISFNEEIYREKLKLHTEQENSENVYEMGRESEKENYKTDLNLFYDNLKILTDEVNTPNKKEEAFNFFLRNIENFVFTQNEENFLFSLLLEKNWEKINGAILILSLILEKDIESFDNQKIISVLDNNFINLIKQHEYRLRANLTNIFKLSTLKIMKSKNFGLIKKWINELFSDIFCNFENVNHSENNQNPTLETSKNILNEILLEIKFCVEKGCATSEEVFGEISDFFQNSAKSLIINLQNENKGIKSMSYEILKNLIFFGIFKSNNFQIEIFKNLSFGLVDFYPQNRYTSSLFLLEFGKFFETKILLENKYFFEKILPKICLNRYIPVEGVKNTSLEIWKLIAQTNGVHILKENFEIYFIQYLSEMNSKSHVAREAACRCLQEIIMKVFEEQMHREIIDRHQTLLLNSMEKCIKDPCWNVRESCLYSAGYVFDVLFRTFNEINFFKKKNSNLFINLAGLIKSHLFDNIYEVRAASAYGIKIIMSLTEKEVLENLENLNEYKIEICETNQLEIFSIFDSPKFLSFMKSLINQININCELKTSFEMFNSEMRKKIENRNSFMINNNEKCCPHHNNFIPDLGFSREVDLWEYTDGIIHLIKELCENPKTLNKLGIHFENILMTVIDYLCKNYAILQNLIKKTLWIAINSALEKINKSEIDIYFELVQNILFKEIKENQNNVSVFEAENLLITVSNLKGKRYVMNKIKNFQITDSNGNFMNRIEKLLNN